jgi:hypothetical protein
MAPDSGASWEIFKKIAKKSTDSKTVEITVGLGKILSTGEDDTDSMEYPVLDLSQRDPSEWSSPLKKGSFSVKVSRQAKSTLYAKAKAFVRKVLTHPASTLCHSMNSDAENAFYGKLVRDAGDCLIEGQYAWDAFEMKTDEPESFLSIDTYPFLSDDWFVQSNKGNVPTKGLFPRDASGSLVKKTPPSRGGQSSSADAPMFKLASAIESINNPRSYRKSILLDIKRVPRPEEISTGANTSLFHRMHCVTDLGMSIYDAFIDGCKGTRIRKATSLAMKQNMIDKEMVCELIIEDKWEQPLDYWKSYTIQDAADNLLTAKMTVLHVVVVFKDVEDVSEEDDLI